MRTIRFGLVVGLALLMAGPVFAQAGGGGGGGGRGGRGGGARGGGMGMMGMGQQGLTQITAIVVSPAAGLSDAQVATAGQIIAANLVKSLQLTKAGAYTAEQRANMATAMAAVRGTDPAPTGQALRDALNAQLKVTDAQVQAQKDLAALVASVVDQIKKAIPDKADAIQAAVDAGARGGMRGGRGGGGGRGGRGGGAAPPAA